MMKKVRCFLEILRPFVKPFLIVFAIYCFAMLAVWRSGVSFVDDRGRAIFGYAWTSDFNRFSSTAFGLAMNANDRLLDISPWPQILGMGILSVVSVMLTYVFCNKKIKYLPLVLTTFVGLLPLTVECWLYKFDAPCIICTGVGVADNVVAKRFCEKIYFEIWYYYNCLYADNVDDVPGV